MKNKKVKTKKSVVQIGPEDVNDSNMLMSSDQSDGESESETQAEALQVQILRELQQKVRCSRRPSCRTSVDSTEEGARE